MSLKLSSLTQVNPGACTHYRVEMVLDEQSLTTEVSLFELDDWFKDFPGGYKQALVLALTNYRLEHGVPVEDLNKRVRISAGGSNDD